MQPTLSGNLCPNCKYWDRHENDPYGVCRANPPAGHGWPRTSRDDWCGAFAAKPIPVVLEKKKKNNEP